MPVANVRDHRSNHSDVRCDAIFEPSAHDNSVKGATQFENEYADFTYHEISDTNVAQAILWAAEKPFPITLYIYDPLSINKPQHRLNFNER